ncbi:MAG: MoaD/ThiS family protein [Chloroflexota bacterium]
MSVKIQLASYLAQFTNGREVVEVKGKTVGECLRHLAGEFPAIEKRLFAEKDRLHDFVSIYINDEEAYPDELAKPVKDGDLLQVLFMIGGG